jgi:hypothetical protein
MLDAPCPKCARANLVIEGHVEIEEGVAWYSFVAACRAACGYRHRLPEMEIAAVGSRWIVCPRGRPTHG